MKCKTCLTEKLASEFYKYNKIKCKECLRQYSRNYVKENYNVIRASQTSYHTKDYIREYRRKNKDKISKYYKEWYRKNGRKKDPIKDAARSIFNNAIKYKRIKRGKTCQECGGKNHIEGHHTDYYQPLNVVWLCKLCHEERHSKT